MRLLRSVTCVHSVISQSLNLWGCKNRWARKVMRARNSRKLLLFIFHSTGCLLCTRRTRYPSLRDDDIPLLLTPVDPSRRRHFPFPEGLRNHNAVRSSEIVPVFHRSSSCPTSTTIRQRPGGRCPLHSSLPKQSFGTADDGPCNIGHAKTPPPLTISLPQGILQSWGLH